MRKAHTILIIAAISFICSYTAFAEKYMSEMSPTYSFEFYRLKSQHQKEVRCLADNIYFEAAHESTKGKIAVAFVTINRAEDKNYPSSICEVVTQKDNGKCQFSWYCMHKQKSAFVAGEMLKRDDQEYSKILELASYVYANKDQMEDPTRGALFYHADYVNPGWKNLKQSARIGKHIFYKK